MHKIFEKLDFEVFEFKFPKADKTNVCLADISIKKKITFCRENICDFHSSEFNVFSTSLGKKKSV